MTRPTVKPKPIGPHPHAGQYQVVVSFRVREPNPDWIERVDPVKLLARVVNGSMTVHVREIGAGGEASEMEGEGP